MKTSIRNIMIIYPLILFSIGCAYENRARIIDVAELNGNLYIATSDNHFNKYDINKNEFNKINGLEGSKISKIIHTKDSLIVEAISVEGAKTEDIFTIHANGDVTNNLKVAYAVGYSSLISADDKYIYALKNDLIEDADHRYIFTMGSFKFNKQTKDKIKNHFDEDVNLIVRDIFEDDHYYWYACYSNPIAAHWTSIRGNLVVVRRDKITNEQKRVALGNDIFEDPTYITGDQGNILVLVETKCLFKISGQNLTYEKLQRYPPHLIIQNKQISKDDVYLWTLNASRDNVTLHRFDKRDLKNIQSKELTVLENTNTQYLTAIVDDKFIWIGLSQYRSHQVWTYENYSPYLLRVSKTDLTTTTIPIQTTFAEGTSNVLRSFFRDIPAFFAALFGGLN